VIRTGSSVAITDHQSANGTWINGDQISDRPVIIMPGDHVVVGGLPFTYRTV